MDFMSPEKTQHDIASAPWRNPPPGRTFEMTQHLPPAPQCVEIMSNSIIWDPCGQQWGRNLHWPLLVTNGKKRFRSEGMQERRAISAEAREEAKRTRAAEERYSGNVALAAQAPEEAPDTGGASSSQGNSPSTATKRPSSQILGACQMGCPHERTTLLDQPMFVNI